MLTFPENMKDVVPLTPEELEEYFQDVPTLDIFDQEIAVTFQAALEKNEVLREAVKKALEDTGCLKGAAPCLLDSPDCPMCILEAALKESDDV